MPIRLMALEQASQPKPADDATLRSAIINVANYYLRMARDRTSAEMQALIWQHASTDGTDHGPSCAAFASLTLELGAHVVGQHSWVSGGRSYPWPLHKWADARVNPNPASPNVTSIVQDAQAHHRWHALGHGYKPLPGDWVVFDGHVEVVTKYAHGVLHTIGGDSLPDFSVNAHEYGSPLGAQGVLGFVDNGGLAAPPAASPDGGQVAGAQLGAGMSAIPGAQEAGNARENVAAAADGPPIPGVPVLTTGRGAVNQPARHNAQQPGRAPRGSQPGTGPGGIAVAGSAPGIGLAEPAGWPQAATGDTAIIPGLPIMAHRLPADPTAPSTTPYSRHRPSPPTAPVHDTSAQQAFISQVAPGAIAAQRRYGVPASVTIAQAIDESGWGRSVLATKDHNLFGIKGTGPAGSDLQRTLEYENGQPVTRASAFRVYRNTAESIDDHGKLLATSGYYRKSMAGRRNPNAFAAALTGIYATDPDYGAKIIRLMRQYDLYRYDRVVPASAPRAAAAGPAAGPGPAALQAAVPGTSTPGTAAASRATHRAATRGPGTRDTRTRTAGSRPATNPAATATPGGAPPGALAPATAAPSGAAPGATSQRATPHQARPRPAAPSGAGPGTGPGAMATASATAPGAPPPSGARPASAPDPAPPHPEAPATAPPGPGRLGTAAPGTPGTGAPGKSAPGAPAPARAPASAPPGGAAIPGAPAAASPPAAHRSPPAHRPTAAAGPRAQSDAAQAQPNSVPSTQTVAAVRMADPGRTRERKVSSQPPRKRAGRYEQHIPPSVRNALLSTARGPLLQAEPLYRDVAGHAGIRWELLAACDWMQCQARAKYSPVHGEKLGTVNPGGIIYPTKSEALEQCAEDLVMLARTVYGIDLTAPGTLSVRDLANVFAAFRWGGLLKLHRTSAMEFPYSVAGLTAQHSKMRWPKINEPNTPDKPGSRFRMPFGAVPIVLCLNYPATI